MKHNYLKQLKSGILDQNPTLVQLLGMCPTLATTTSLKNAFGMGMAVSKSAEGIARQPEAEGKIRTTLMLGLVFIETAIIYALLVVILLLVGVLISVGFASNYYNREYST